MKQLYWLLLGTLPLFASCNDSSADSEITDMPVPIRLAPSVEIQPEGMTKAGNTQPFDGSEFEIEITPVAPVSASDKYEKYTYQLKATKDQNDNWKLDGTYGLPSGPLTDLNGETPLWAGRNIETFVEAHAGKLTDFSQNAPLDNQFLEQSTEANQVAVDFLHYQEKFKPSAKLTDAMNKPFEFDFHHHLSQLNVILKFGTDYNGINMDQIRTDGIQTVGIFNTVTNYKLTRDAAGLEIVTPGVLTQNHTFPNTTGGDILTGVEYIRPLVTVSADGKSLLMKAMLIPQALKAGTELIILRLKKLNGNGFVSGDTWFIYELPKDETFEGGYSYQLTLQIGAGTTTRSATILQKGDWQ